MKSELRLTITFRGTGAGLEHQRLRIDSFGPALVEMQRAYRRIAQSLIRDAANNERASGDTGRFNRFVRDLAWEIDTISHNSPVQVALACPVPLVPVGDTFSMFTESIMDRAADELMDALRSEADGIPRNAAVRSYLSVLPEGVSNQVYRMEKLTGDIRETDLGIIDRPALDVDYPSFVRRRATVVGLHFPPAHPEVRLQPHVGLAFTSSASNELVDRALEYRSEEMTGLFLKNGKKFQALWLDPGATEREPPPRDVLDAYFARRWGDVLRALAE